MQEWFQTLTLVDVVGLVLKTSIMIQVFALGLETSWQEATYLFRQPRLLLNSILARNVAMPIVAILLITSFSLHPAVAIALGVLAATPVPPLVPKSQLKAGGRDDYILGLLVSQAVLAIVLVPITIRMMSWALGGDARFSAAQVATLMIESVLAPLAAGMLLAWLLPRLRQVAPLLLKAGGALLVLGALPLLVLAWKSLATLSGNGTLLALALFTIAGTAIGHLLGGPLQEDRRSLASATSSRHPGVAVAIANANFPEQSTLVAGAIIIYLILRAILLIPYMKRRKPGHIGQPQLRPHA